MKAKRHTPERVIRKLRVAEVMLTEGKSVAEVARALEVSEQTFACWRNQYGGMKAADAKRLKEFERERPAQASARRQGSREPGAEGVG